jgi:hypothetical protein
MRHPRRRSVIAQNRVQHQKGLSTPEFFERFGSVQQCEERVRGKRPANPS